MPKIFVIGGITDSMKSKLSPKFQLIFVDDVGAPNSWLEANGDEVSYVLTNGHDGIEDNYFSLLPNLKLISNYGVGYDAINIDMALERNVLVTHTPGVLSDEVATTALLLLLSCFRELRANEDHVRSGEWEASGNFRLSRSADNRKIGILGMGRIGQAIADKLAPFHPEILYHARNKRNVPYRYFDSLEAMAGDADALICITTGGASTRHLVNADVLRALGSEGILINVSRGSVVDENALIKALQDNELGGAGLDVFENEPRVPEALRSMENVVLTPHIGSATVETRQAMGDLAVDNLIQHLADGSVISAVPEMAQRKSA